MPQMRYVRRVGEAITVKPVLVARAINVSKGALGGPLFRGGGAIISGGGGGF